MKNPNKTLVVTLGYLPEAGGSYRMIHELISKGEPSNFVVLTSKNKEGRKWDSNVSVTIKRTIFLSLLNDNGQLFSDFKMCQVYEFIHLKVFERLLKFLVLPFIVFLYLFLYQLKYRFRRIVFGQSVYPISWYIRIFKYLFGVRIITFVYGEEIVSYRKPRKLIKILRTIFLRGLQSADAIVTCSDATQEEIYKDIGDTAKVTTIYPSVDYDYFFPKDRSFSKIQLEFEGKYVILSVGRLVRRKGFDLVIQQLPKLISVINNIQYVICGNGPDEKRLRQLVRENNVDGYVKFLHDVSYDMLPTLYSAADIFVMPNRLDEIDQEQEGFGIVFLEANACGIPVIGGDSGGARDAITPGVNGFLVNPDKPEELFELIKGINQGKLILNSERIKEFVVTQFTWSKSAKLFNSLIMT